MKPVIVDNKVVALESVDPPGAVRVIGAAMWSPGWKDRIPDGPDRVSYENAVATQSDTSPRDSPANVLVHNVVGQIPLANKSSTPVTDTTVAPTTEPPTTETPPSLEVTP